MREQKINEILTFLRRSKGLQSVIRYGSSLRDKNNSVAEHSWRLALMAMVVASECKVPVDMSRVMGLALIHDLAEARTGDIDAYSQVMSGGQISKDKAELEAAAMHDMTDDLSFGDWIYNLWSEYEQQKTVEAKFINALDKIEGFLHIAEESASAYIPKEFHADYANKAVSAFDDATHHFPELKDLLDSVKQDLKIQFENAGITWVEAKKT